MKTIKILFADDDLKYSMLLKRFLEAEGYEVTYAGNGNIALQQFPLIRPDLVLLDINMPELNGFEVAAKIRKQNHQVLIFFLSAPGVTVGAHENKMGLRLSNTTDLIFENVRVKASAMVGPEGSGFKLAMNALNLSRAFVATLAVGIMQRALDESVKYAKERKQFNTPIIKFQMVQQMLADMAIKIEASRCLVNNTMKMMDAGIMVQKEGSICKTFVSDCAQEVTSNAVQIFGGYGYSKEYPVEKLMRDVKVFQIFEGANQVQRLTIANVLNKEYK